MTGDQASQMDAAGIPGPVMPEPPLYQQLRQVQLDLLTGTIMEVYQQLPTQPAVSAQMAPTPSMPQETLRAHLATLAEQYGRNPACCRNFCLHVRNTENLHDDTAAHWEYTGLGGGNLAWWGPGVH